MLNFACHLQGSETLFREHVNIIGLHPSCTNRYPRKKEIGTGRCSNPNIFTIRPGKELNQRGKNRKGLFEGKSKVVMKKPDASISDYLEKQLDNIHRMILNF
jgi:hypothetical protein